MYRDRLVYFNYCVCLSRGFCHVHPPLFCRYWEVAISVCRSIIRAVDITDVARTLTYQNWILPAVSNMRPVTSTSLQAMQTVIEALLWGVAINSTCMWSFKQSYLSLSYCLFNLLLSLQVHFFLSVLSFTLSSSSFVLSVPVFLPHILTSQAPSACHHCHSLGNLSVCYRPFTTSSLYGTFSF